MWSSIFVGAATTLAGIVIRLLWDRKIGRHLRAKWHRRWLRKAGVEEGKTIVRLPTPSSFEAWRVVHLDGSDAVLQKREEVGKGEDGVITRRHPMARFRKEGIDIIDLSGKS